MSNGNYSKLFGINSTTSGFSSKGTLPLLKYRSPKWCTISKEKIIDRNISIKEILFNVNLGLNTYIYFDSKPTFKDLKRFFKIVKEEYKVKTKTWYRNMFIFDYNVSSLLINKKKDKNTDCNLLISIDMFPWVELDGDGSELISDKFIIIQHKEYPIDIYNEDIKNVRFVEFKNILIERETNKWIEKIHSLWNKLCSMFA